MEDNRRLNRSIPSPPIQKMKTLMVENEMPTTPASGRGIDVMHPGGDKSVSFSLNATISATDSSVCVEKAGGLPSVTPLSSPQRVEGPNEPIIRGKNDYLHQQSSSSELKTHAPPQREQSAIITKKKAKRDEIDEIYSDYNDRFSDACQQLRGLATEWRQLLEENKDSVSEEIEGDICSSLGKVKLLLESKLPQFGELLNAYLFKDKDARITLGCDLEGWWDVAYMQVEAVYKEFEHLTTLKKNNWVSPLQPPSSLNIKPMRFSLSNDGAARKSGKLIASGPPNRSKMAAKAEASGGLKLFLSTRRKMLSRTSAVDGEGNTKKKSESMDVSTSNIQKIKGQMNQFSFS